MSLVQELQREGQIKLWHDYSKGSLLDLSPNANNGVFVNSPFINRRGVSVNGVDNYIQVLDSSSLSFGDGANDSPFTFIVKLHQTSSQSFFIHKTDDSAVVSNLEYAFRTDPTGRLLIQAYDASASANIGKYANAGTNLVAGKTNIVSATYNGNKTSAGFALYVNGIAIASATYESGVYTAMENLAKNVGIGRYDGFYSKTVYEYVMIISRALTATEIAQIVGELENKKY